MQDKSKLKKRLGLLFKILIPTACLAILYYQITKNDIEYCGIPDGLTDSSTNVFYYALFAILLMPVNWLIESYKWYVIINKSERISFLTSTKATLSGLSVSILFPFRIGEYLGRINFIEKKKLGVLLTIVCSMTQLVATLLFGFVGLFLIEQSIFSEEHIKWLSSITVVLVLGILIGLKFFPIWLKNIFKWKQTKKLFVQMAKITSVALLLRIQILSLVRYMIFTSQYMLLFYAFGIDIPVVQLFAIISLMYLATTAVPVNQIVELGSSKSLILISLISGFVELVQLQSCYIATIGFIIWLLNIVIPSLIGLVFLTIHKKSLLEK
jgi:hypothetical protein